jgi:hypothetical protein
VRWRAHPEDPADRASFGDEVPAPIPTLIVLLVIAFGPRLLASASAAANPASEPLPARPGGNVTTPSRISSDRTHGRYHP